MSVRKGDMVVVVAGKDKGKRGRVLRMVHKKNRLVVERIAMVKRHTKPSQRNAQGGILEKEGSLAMSNVMLWCAKCSAGRRSRIDGAGTEQKRRVCVKCAGVFEAT